MTGEEPLLLAPRMCAHCWAGTLTATGAPRTYRLQLQRAAVAVAATWQYFERIGIGTQPASQSAKLAAQASAIRNSTVWLSLYIITPAAARTNLKFIEFCD